MGRFESFSGVIRPAESVLEIFRSSNGQDRGELASFSKRSSASVLLAFACADRACMLDESSAYSFWTWGVACWATWMEH